MTYSSAGFSLSIDIANCRDFDVADEIEERSVGEFNLSAIISVAYVVETSTIHIKFRCI